MTNTETLTPSTRRTLEAVRATGLGNNGAESGRFLIRAERAGLITLISTSPYRWALTPAGEAALTR